VAGSMIEGNIEQSHWLYPMQDRRRQGAIREELLDGFSLSSYSDLVTGQPASTAPARQPCPENWPGSCNAWERPRSVGKLA